ncbi:hypothetical protein KAURM247S_00003 [Kitasatospora aureofaciens]
MHFATKTIDSTAKAAYTRYVAERFQREIAGTTVITQLAIHWAEAATDSAAARTRLGNISPSMTQTTTPQDNAKHSTKALAEISATVPWRSGSETLSPEPVAEENAQPAAARVTAMPAEPIRASGLRPTRSTSRIAITVPRMLMTEPMKLISSELLWSMPTDCHRIDE